MDAARRRARYEDLMALPEGERAEILGGEIATLPAPRPRHSQPQGAIRRFIGGPFDDDDGFGGPGGWWIFVEVDVQLGEDVVRPDFRRNVACSGHAVRRRRTPGGEAVSAEASA